MYDNKIRLSKDVLDKAEQIASEWGLKNTRAAVEAVFRRYCEEYRHGRNPSTALGTMQYSMPPSPPRAASSSCEALDALDELLAL
ncbi:hypothetical protein XM38_002530 [Halomicronema hongdechloris C2206]|uniref:Uncharacterized protein n=1 Tax=Halomicronema hongdechloris C2206 TaxID=1641165 RepID=A0A1Z3HGC9_9CYAN|nr:hypothetical protein [Halomicronema hongdechloris]ASC69326.1 hypothetical protein XM38_002530 [Halomicronema hongdechloris C2206]